MKKQYYNPRTERVELDPLMVQFGGTQSLSIATGGGEGPVD